MDELAELKAEREMLMVALEATIKELDEARRVYYRHGDLSVVWRQKFDERFFISRRLQVIDRAIGRLIHNQNAAYKVA